MDDGWGPRIRHDGAGVNLPDGTRLRIEYLGSGIMPGIDEHIGPNWPGWFWRWRWVRHGWFEKRRVRVCDDPRFAPIIAYWIRRPPAIELLRELAADPERTPVVRPEREVETT